MCQSIILVVDDDQKIRRLLRNCFESDGAVVYEAENAAAALKTVSERQIDLITLDLHMGADDGLDVARRIRKTSQVPIIIVTGKNDVIDRVVGLELGADDYITKPFHIREVLARARSVLRRTSQSMKKSGSLSVVDDLSERIVQFDGLVALRNRMELRGRDGQSRELTSGDFKLLNVFLDNPKHALSRERLMDLINGPEWTPLDRTIDNQVARLRKKIERDPTRPKLIKTVRGVGYMFACDLQPVTDQVSEKTA